MTATETDVVARILRAAEASIEHFGLQRFTMGDVAKASGVRRQALYDHVGGRDDLVRAVLAAKARRLRERATEVIDRQRYFASKVVEGLLFIVEDSLAEPYMQGLVGEGEFAMISKIVGADRLMPKLTGEIWRPVLEAAERDGHLVAGHNYDDIERWLTYVTLMLVGSRAQSVSDEQSDRRLLARMLLPALVR
ncbi:TetR/AcrR family transcriptional regulator [Pseudonocardia sp. Cha107L01]|uniref:TetR/AcrR family transcriptional regulator n=1 Tax=Pseudonocardia sp. Cha107L01 TaxID=3457576 RepID=UPI00403E4B15